MGQEPDFQQEAAGLRAPPPSLPDPVCRYQRMLCIGIGDRIEIDQPSIDATADAEYFSPLGVVKRKAPRSRGIWFEPELLAASLASRQMSA